MNPLMNAPVGSIIALPSKPGVPRQLVRVMERDADGVRLARLEPQDEAYHRWVEESRERLNDAVWRYYLAKTTQKQAETPLS